MIATSIKKRGQPRNAAYDADAPRAGQLDGGSMEIVGIGPLDFHGDDVALPQRAARDNMNLAVDLGRVALGTAPSALRPALVDQHVEPPPDPYELSAPVDEPEPAPRSEKPVHDERVQREIALRTREAPNPPPASPLWSGVYEFPLYENCRKSLLHLMLWGAGSAWIFRMLMGML